MSSPLTVLPLSNTLIDASGDYTPVFVSAGASIIVERDAGTPAGDAVAVTFGGLSLAAASSITVQSGASLTLSDLLGANGLVNFDIGSNGTLILAPSSGVSVAIPTSFTGYNGSLVLTQTATQLALLGPVSGFNASDTIDFRGVTAATSVAYANGVLNILNGGTVVGSVNLSGSFSTATLGLAADGKGGYVVGDNVGGGMLRLSGSSSQYHVATSGSTVLIQDTVPGRDPVQAAAAGQAIGFSDGVALSDPNGVAEVVTHLYQAVLGRAPDLAGLQAFTNAVNSGAVPYATIGDSFVAAALPEDTARYGSLNDTQFVDLLAHDTNTSLDDPKVAATINQLSAGVSRGAVAFVFAESANGIAATGSYAGDNLGAEVYRLYEATLGRAPDPAGSQGFLTELQSGQSASTAALQMLSSAEFASKFGVLSNNDFTTKLYQNSLGRAPDAAGYQNVVTALNNGASRADITVGFANSAEARLNTSAATHDGVVFLKS